MHSQLTDHGITPFGILQLAADIGTHLPVQLDQLGIHRLHSLAPGTLNQCKHFIETIVGFACGSEGYGHAWVLVHE
ncbi:hypothetical protein D3C80_1704880 [compost metagenome]